MGMRLGQVCVNNVWIPDGMKDTPVNRFRYREYLEEALDRIFEEKFDKNNMRDVCEGKLFGIGKEAFTVGSHEFHLAYAVKNGIGVCMDTGHYHPTETIADKISAVYKFVDTVMLHISRGIRWDSDHVLIQNDDLSEIMKQVVRGGLQKNGKIFIGLDYFDATINRVAAHVIGLRAAGKALFEALLEPFDMLNKTEFNGNYTERLAISEEIRNLPANAVWDYLCLKTGVPVGIDWIEKLNRYEAEVMLKRK